ncbi:MAG: adenylosuccinate synthase [Chloroflexi bacterium]|nr:adenylosuccinate synthase [Chloroflexota bacterium]
MPVSIVVGAQWGDEGKGKVIDMLAEKAHTIVRYSGGDNAGHTVINPHGHFQLHLIPSGICYPEKTCIIGNGVAINPEVFLKERQMLNDKGISTSNLFISDRAQIVMPYHLTQDKLEEQARQKGEIGTTLRGIGPAFVDKIARMGLRAGELIDEKSLKERLKVVLEYKNKLLTCLYCIEPFSFDEIYAQYSEYGRKIKEHVTEATVILEEALKRGDNILLEGAQGSLLDPDFGTYPYATSSSPLAANACLGSGVGPTAVDEVLGVYKAYCTRVGAGPFPTELFDEMGERIRRIANEYGTTTGRPRRVGWFDAIAARFSCRINGFSGMAITRLDIMDKLPSIKICTGYMLDGKKIDHFPAQATVLNKCRPIYEEMKGWLKPTNEIEDYNELPTEAKAYLDRLEELVCCPVDMVCVGPAREQTIFKKKT